MKHALLPLLALCLFSCSKNSSPGAHNGTTPYNNGQGLVPLALNEQFNYKLVNYNVSNGAFVDSVKFTMTVTDTSTMGGVTYFKLLNSLTGGTLWLTNLNATTLGSIDSLDNTAYTFFVSGTGDSTQSVATWSAPAGTCTGTEQLYAYFADTTLTDLNGTVYAGAIKNDAVIFNCSGEKYVAQVYFVKAGVGIVRYVQYVYYNGGRLEQLYWVLESTATPS